MMYERFLKRRLGLIVIVMCGLMCLGMDSGKAPVRRISPGWQRLNEAHKLGPEEKDKAVQALLMNYRFFDQCLVAREQGEFLLTPALLVQEAVSDDVILTYPEE